MPETILELSDLAREIATPPDPTIKPEITRSRKELVLFQHRTFGERTFSHYKSKTDASAAKKSCRDNYKHDRRGKHTYWPGTWR